MSKSSDLFSKSRELIPGGVNSPVRAFRSVGGEPLFISRAFGSKIEDADGNTYIDYVGSWGPMIVGHAHKEVLTAITDIAERGTSFGAPTETELTLAQMVIEAVPSMEMVRMVNSGTEATMSAIRLARGATGRDKIVKFNGCYHGHSDGLLVFTVEKQSLDGITLPAVGAVESCHEFSGRHAAQSGDRPQSFANRIDPINASPVITGANCQPLLELFGDPPWMLDDITVHVGDP